MSKARVGILHYSAAPVVGGVESVISAHARLFSQHGYPVTVIAGEGSLEALPEGLEFTHIPELSSQQAEILRQGEELAAGSVPGDFEGMVDRIARRLEPVLAELDVLFVHNVFTKHFNLALTAALARLLDQKAAPRTVAWCHDFTWTSTHSRSQVHPGYPWDLLRAYRPDLTYVTISAARRRELARLLGIPEDDIEVVYNGVDPRTVLGLSDEGFALAQRLGLLDADLALLMPVRITQAKNIELALRVTKAVKERADGVLCVVLTGPPDPHSAENMAYYRELLALRSQLGVEDEFRFVYQSGEESEGLTIPESTVGDLYRLADAVFMPSRREGFGMPVLEAGLSGLPVVASENVPAAEELGGASSLIVEIKRPPREIARQMMEWLEQIPGVQMKRKTRTQLTWEAIFTRQIEPLAAGEVTAVHDGHSEKG